MKAKFKKGDIVRCLPIEKWKDISNGAETNGGMGYSLGKVFTIDRIEESPYFVVYFPEEGNGVYEYALTKDKVNLNGV